MIASDYQAALIMADRLLTLNMTETRMSFLENEIKAAITYCTTATVNMRYILDRADKIRSDGMGGPDRHRIEDQEKEAMYRELRRYQSNV